MIVPVIIVNLKWTDDALIGVDDAVIVIDCHLERLLVEEVLEGKRCQIGKYKRRRIFIPILCNHIYMMNL